VRVTCTCGATGSGTRCAVLGCAYQSPHDHTSADLVPAGKGTTVPGTVSLRCATSHKEGHA
jgi:hypothetical protein